MLCRVIEIMTGDRRFVTVTKLRVEFPEQDFMMRFPLQMWLGCSLAAMILMNGIIALALWSKYGKMISERFMKPGKFP